MKYLVMMLALVSMSSFGAKIMHSTCEYGHVDMLFSGVYHSEFHDSIDSKRKNYRFDESGDLVINLSYRVQGDEAVADLSIKSIETGEYLEKRSYRKLIWARHSYDLELEMLQWLKASLPKCRLLDE